MARVFILLVPLLVFILTIDAETTIPLKVMQKLKNVRNFEELEESGIEVLDSEDDKDTASPSTDSHSPLRDLKIDQGKDWCKVVSTCVETEKNADTGVITFPECHEVSRCAGSCCVKTYTCKPVQTREIVKKTIDLKYLGPTTSDEKEVEQFSMHRIYNQTLVEHMSCECVRIKE